MSGRPWDFPRAGVDGGSGYRFPAFGQAANALAPPELRNPDGTKPPLDKPVDKPNTVDQVAVDKAEKNDLLMYLGAGVLLITGTWLAFFRKKG